MPNNHSVSAKVLKNAARLGHAMAGSPQVRIRAQDRTYFAHNAIEPPGRTSSENQSQNVSIVKTKHHVSMYLNDVRQMKGTLSVGRDRFRTLDKRSNATRDMSYHDD